VENFTCDIDLLIVNVPTFKKCCLHIVVLLYTGESTGNFK